MSNNKQIGVITEQGFVAGSGLGFNPVESSKLNPNKKPTDEKEKNDNKK